MSHKNKIKINCRGELYAECKIGTRVSELLADEIEKSELPVLGALVNNEVVCLHGVLEVDSEVELITMRHPQGWHMYRQSLSFLLAKAMHEALPEAEFAVEHSLGSGFYCSYAREGKPGITMPDLKRLEEHLQQLIKRDLPIESAKLSFADAVESFRKFGQYDKYNLLRFRNPPMVNVYVCQDFFDLAHGVLADSTAKLKWFKLVPYESGFVLQFPERDAAPEMSRFKPQPHLFSIFKEHKSWGRILGVRTAGDLNEIIAYGDIADFVRTAEALHEKKIAHIADQIAASENRVKWIFLAGPSSSGKTTLAKRLAVHLKVNGIRAHDISLDDYFLNRDNSPLDAEGKPDFEHIEAIDLPFLHEQLLEIDRGRAVDRPRYHFGKGEREFRGEQLLLGEREVAIIEGIHGLNPQLTGSLPAERIKRIYVSALTQLNLDSNNRISTTDNRLIRRIVRDYKYRGHSALRTLQMWSSVRKGEKRWIFPYQQEADFAFNSALDYELAVLRALVEPLLAEVKPWHAEYAQARRLMSFVASFLNMPMHWVPPTSLLREFIGRSNFRYG